MRAHVGSFALLTERNEELNGIAVGTSQCVRQAGVELGELSW